MRVWVTRDEDPNGSLSTALRACHLQPILEPVIARRLLADMEDLARDLGPEDWLVLTSIFAIEAVADTVGRVPKVAVVGEPSAKRARELGLRVELVGSGVGGESLFADLRRLVHCGRVRYLRSSLASPLSSWENVEVSSPVIYETEPRVFDRSVAQRVDVVAVASPSAVRAVGDVGLPFASIGPVTSKAIREIGCGPWVEASHPTFQSLASVIADQARDSRHQRA